ncbi:uncharacterized protein An16g03220 [Aspergillus niger]|uniref:Contig An16c0110, genomic contig n=2 Tax=Aspergillus niger TaxID=5061 RepID=A2R7E3_ASPNC|nr:uncharacterized protein An16g03220 [Aspergillus niger]CAK42821.1 unnamed protein product [Aspergillus niger]
MATRVCPSSCRQPRNETFLSSSTVSDARVYCKVLAGIFHCLKPVENIQWHGLVGRPQAFINQICPEMEHLSRIWIFQDPNVPSQQQMGNCKISNDQTPTYKLVGSDDINSKTLSHGVCCSNLFAQAVMYTDHSIRKRDTVTRRPKTMLTSKGRE